jgi:hydrogenase nickel incorporation protein HypA/HybF
VHELSIAGAVLETVLRHAGGRPVTAVGVRVGRLRQVVPDSLLFYWPIVTRETVCEGARLELEQVEARLRCSACGQEWEPWLTAFRCPACSSGEVMVRSGEELEVEYIEVEQQEAACTASR